MKLANKTFIYSIALAGVVGLFIIGYLLLMLPSLYTANRQAANLESFKASFTGIIENLDTENMTAKSIGIRLPLEGYKIELFNAVMQGDIEIKDESLKEILDRLRGVFKSGRKFGKDDDITKNYAKEFEKCFEDIKVKLENSEFIENRSIAFNIKMKENTTEFSDEMTKFYRLGERSFIVELGVKDNTSDTYYTTLIGFYRGDNEYIIAVDGAVAPSVSDIIPVILGILPVIIPVTILLIFITSGFYSRNIVKPITMLLRDADNRRGTDGYVEPIIVKGNDEIAGLAASLNLLYKSQEEAYKRIGRESERKEVFMRAFSHQLKTPIAAAALLADGMISNIGKFSDRDKYLPEVKKQLMNMQKITDEILMINRIADSLSPVNADIRTIAEYTLNSCKIAAEDKNLTTSCDGEANWYCDPNILEQILLNLVNNAVKYTDDGGEIMISLTGERIEITNRPSHIDENIKDSLFEAFVTGGGSESGHGLGLYVAKYFAEISGFKIELNNYDDRVTFTVLKERKE